ncbi:hypothetical protein [Streptomyces sp. NPDC001970]
MAAEGAKVDGQSWKSASASPNGRAVDISPLFRRHSAGSARLHPDSGEAALRGARYGRYSLISPS